MDHMKASKVVFLKKLPDPTELEKYLNMKLEKCLVVCDQNLRASPDIGRWLKDRAVYFHAKSGESLKELDRFPGYVKKILPAIEPFSPQTGAIIGLGGGTVGDFTGFFASVYKRGAPLVHVPTTLLAAMDSAHGGKTALNVGQYKNQLGTFYPAELILIVQSLFESLPPGQMRSAAGELAKMALIEGGELYEKLSHSNLCEFNTIWSALPGAIAAKMSIVERDPLEKTGERKVLNLGHTLGHVLEGFYKAPHGIAVGLGLEFSVRWSSHYGFMSEAESEKALRFLREQAGVQASQTFLKRRSQIPAKQFVKWLVRDKKIVNTQNVDFVFLEKVGAPFMRTVPFTSLTTEAKRQGWVKS